MRKTPKHQALVRTAVDLFKSQAKLAAAMGCSQQQIAYLLKAPSISVEMAVRIHNATDGRVPKHALRPDFFEAPAEEQAA